MINSVANHVAMDAGTVAFSGLTLVASMDLSRVNQWLATLLIVLNIVLVAWRISLLRKGPPK